MIRCGGAVVLGLVVAAAGCRGEEEAPGGRTPYEELVIASDTAEGFGTEAPAGVTPVQGGATRTGPLTATGNLRGAGTDRAVGMVTVTGDARQTRLLVTVQGMTVGARAQAVVARGRCGEAGQALARAGDTITIGAEGIATQETRVDVPTEQLLDGRHSIRLQTPAGEGTADVQLACADLPHTVGAAVQ